MAFTPFRHEEGHLIQTVESIGLQAWLFAVPVTVAKAGDPHAHNFLFFFSFLLNQSKKEKWRSCCKAISPVVSF